MSVSSITSHIFGRRTDMESASSALHLNPARSGFRKSVQGNQPGKAMVVGCDYVALTSRHDPNVIFWPVGVAQANTPMPPKVTHLWISDFISEEAKANLLRHAKNRNITVWKCSLVELRQRLLSFWSNPSNRSMVTPAEANGSETIDERGKLVSFKDDEDVPAHNRGLSSVIDVVATDVDSAEIEIEDRTGEEAEAIPKLRRRSRFRKPTAKDKALAARLKLMKSVHRNRSGNPVPQPEAAAVKPESEIGQPAPVVEAKPGNGKLSFGRLGFEEVVSNLLKVEKQPKVAKAPRRAILSKELEAVLQRCSLIDQEVFLYHLKHCSCRRLTIAVHSEKSVNKTAKEFGMGNLNVKKCLERVTEKLAQTPLV